MNAPITLQDVRDAGMKLLKAKKQPVLRAVLNDEFQVPNISSLPEKDWESCLNRLKEELAK